MLHKPTGGRRPLAVQPQSVITANPGLQATRCIAADARFVERTLRPELFGLGSECTPMRHWQKIFLHGPSALDEIHGQRMSARATHMSVASPAEPKTGRSNGGGRAVAKNSCARCNPMILIIK
ncbi:MAG: hypothetical protein KGI32_05055 [Gammaproteobacteria bacterium]|nr:hypothetical protein [Gammaproteobacteria bacterium]